MTARTNYRKRTRDSWSRTCNICDRTFSKSEHLTRHQRSHTGERPFKCTECDRTYARSDVLARHIRGHHPPLDGRTEDAGEGATRLQNTPSPEASQPTVRAEDQDAAEHVGGMTTTASSYEPPVAPRPPSVAQSHQPLHATIKNDNSFSRMSDSLSKPSQTIDPGHRHTSSLSVSENGIHPLEQSGSFEILFHNLPNTSASFQPENSPQSHFETSNRSLQPVETNRGDPDAGVGVTPARIFPVEGNPHRLDELNENGIDLSDLGLPALLDPFDFLAHATGFLTPRSGGSQLSSSLPRDCIPNERFEQVKRFWPTRRRTKPLSSTPLKWDDIVNHPSDNLFSSPVLTGHFEPLEGMQRMDSWWHFTQGCRDRLMQEYNYHVQKTNDSSPTSIDASSNLSETTSTPDAMSTSSRLSWDGGFPPADILDMSLDLYFYQFHNLLPMVHAPTFDATKTPTALLYPMCLIGLSIFNRKAGRTLIVNTLPGAIDQCRAEISSKAYRYCPAPQLLTTLTSACLLLFLAATMPELAYEEQRQSLYEEALSLAQQRECFKAPAYHQIFQQDRGGDNASTWKAWARVESAKRIIISLTMADAYSAHIFGIAPIIQSEKMQIFVPCPGKMFEAQTAQKWEISLETCNSWTSNIQALQPGFDSLPPVLSGYGMEAILSSVWMRISEAQHRLIRSTVAPDQSQSQILVPCDIFATDEIARSIGPCLVGIIEGYGLDLVTGNTNLMILWHFLCLGLTVNMTTIELAAGRSGPQVAKQAVDLLAAWANSPAARRACLHAAQILVVTTRRKVSDGVMLHSELGLFSAALVLGLYLMTAPDSFPNHSPTIDLLEEIDWTSVGGEGLAPDWQPNNRNYDSLAADFIRNGGSVSFAGAAYRSGYSAARKTFMNFAALLETSGKWNVQEYCHILRIISDTLIEPEE